MRLMSMDLSAMVYYFLLCIEEAGHDPDASPDRHTLNDLDQWLDDREFEGDTRLYRDLELDGFCYKALRAELVRFCDDFGRGTPLSDHVDQQCLAEEDDFIF